MSVEIPLQTYYDKINLISTLLLSVEITPQTYYDKTNLISTLLMSVGITPQTFYDKIPAWVDNPINLRLRTQKSVSESC